MSCGKVSARIRLGKITGRESAHTGYLSPAGVRNNGREMSIEAPLHADAVARFDRVALRYGHGPEILRDISLELPTGSFHFLIGRSGVGKTSLLRLLYMALRPTRGHLELFGTDVAQAPRADLPGSAAGSASSSQTSPVAATHPARQRGATAAARRP